MTNVDQLADIAVQLAVRVRDEDPEANGRWLKAMLPSSADWFRLAFVLAAAVPDDRSWKALTAWIDQPAKPSGKPQLRPHGTVAAASRHRRRKEPLCGPCREATRASNRGSAAARRAA